MAMLRLLTPPKGSIGDMTQMERRLVQHVCAGRQLLATETTIGIATDKGLVKGYDLHNTCIFTPGSSAILCCPQAGLSGTCGELSRSRPARPTREFGVSHRRSLPAPTDESSCEIPKCRLWCINFWVDLYTTPAHALCEGQISWQGDWSSDACARRSGCPPSGLQVRRP